MQPLAIYIHYPFCLSLCPYCDFNVYIKQSLSEAEYLQGIKKEIALLAALGDKKLTSIFFGGGTPSLLSSAAVAEIILSLSQQFSIDEKIEITLETNPENAEDDYFKSLARAGVNRLSLGIQSLDGTALKFLGRTHSPLAAQQAIELGKKHFDNLSFDLIYARPNQTLAAWAEELRLALTFAPRHLSLYQLEIHRGTAFEKKVPSPPCEENLAARLWEESEKLCARAGLARYEISNYAAEGYQSQHNLAYWLYQNYAGLGPGAHGRLTLPEPSSVVATQTPRHPKQWLHSTQQQNFDAHFQCEVLSLSLQAKEKLLMGLRLKQGVLLAGIPLTGVSSTGLALTENKVQPLIDLGLLEKKNGFLTTTSQGALVLDSLVASLID